MPNVLPNGVWPNTDLDLNKSADLPECPVDYGMWPDSLSSATSAALTRGFQTDVSIPDEGPRGEGGTPTDIDPRGYPVSGFVRPEAFRKESFLPV